ncbi:hypothetical protein IQ05_01070 [Flavobacterium tiangeerense]|uniref:Uncharacterized protein n=1 Tax=Flavobacterium tiangeerense TaxID=459471 RepID=A0ABY3FKA7_9FLAO|nr:hypothetical protein IQ05_01070 [Flavobacterium tiangeerense]
MPLPSGLKIESAKVILFLKLPHTALAVFVILYEFTFDINFQFGIPILEVN